MTKATDRIPIPALTIDIEIQSDATQITDEARRAVGLALELAAFKSAQLVKATWIGVAKAHGLSAKGDYIDGIDANGRIDVDARTTDPNADYYEAAITITNTSKHASIIEDGHGAFSLPQAIRWGQTPRQKRFKNGTPYIVVPFRHGAFRTPDEQERGGVTGMSLRRMMPSSIYSQAKNLAPTSRENAGVQRTADGQFIAADRYRWGGRLKDTRAVGESAQIYGTAKQRARATEMGREQTVIARRGPTSVGVDHDGNELSNPAWTASRWSGMVRTTGGKGHTEYMTFRIITPKSKGWRIPARAGLKIAQRVLADVESGALGKAIGEQVQAEVTAAIEQVRSKE